MKAIKIYDGKMKGIRIKYGKLNTFLLNENP
jgi:hypothetical protein